MEQGAWAVLTFDKPNPSDGVPTAFSTTLRKALNGFTLHFAVFGEALDLSPSAVPHIGKLSIGNNVSGGATVTVTLLIGNSAMVPA